jgi:hypothetical protein
VAACFFSAAVLTGAGPTPPAPGDETDEILNELFPVAGDGSTPLSDLIGDAELAKVDQRILQRLFMDVAGSSLCIIVDLELLYREDHLLVRRENETAVVNLAANFLKDRGHHLPPAWLPCLYLWLHLRRSIAEAVRDRVSYLDFIAGGSYDVFHAVVGTE